MQPLTLDQSNRLISAALAHARERSLPPLAVAVLDDGGHLKALQREDGVSFLRVRICQAKAWGALGFAVDSRAIAERYARGGLQSGFIDALNSMTGGRVIPLPGGLLIHDADGALLGAVGIAGADSEDDEACARVGIRAIGLDHGRS